jgi:very-short-patch-repair endonuclease
MGGFKFRRQYIIENFIVDFYCDEMKLVIEIDGDVHGYKNKAEHDKRKEDFLKARGYEVARYTNYEIYNNLENVLEDLLRKCEERKRENII